MAATTVNDFYLRYVKTPPDEATLLRLSKRLTIFWGIVQLVVALGAQWLDQSVLDAGLSVLSLTTGPVLGAFLVGVLTRRVGAAAMIGGMARRRRGAVCVWWTGAVGWTWYALLGASVSGAERPRAEPGAAGRSRPRLLRRSDASRQPVSVPGTSGALAAAPAVPTTVASVPGTSGAGPPRPHGGKLSRLSSRALHARRGR